jgi:uncharacterized protein YycO
VPTNRLSAAIKGLALAALVCPLASFAPPGAALAGRAVQGAPDLSAIDSAALQDGDLIFRQGRDLIAGAVLAADGAARFSHVGLIVTDKDTVWVIHAVPSEGGDDGGVVKHSLAAFLDPGNAADFAIYRHRTLAPDQRRIVRETALDAIGTPFDYDMQLSDAEALYCSELVLRAYAAARAPFPDRLRTVQTVLMAEPAVTPDGLREARVLSEVTRPG